MDMDNFKRGDRGEAVMRYYTDPDGLKGGSADSPMKGEPWDLSPIGGSSEHHFPDGYPVSDMIADVCHALRRHDIDIDQVLHKAVAQFAADVIEQAWENSEEWDDHMQDESNIERAVTVMEAAGVPEWARQEALVLTGLIPPEGEDH